MCSLNLGLLLTKLLQTVHTVVFVLGVTNVTVVCNPGLDS